MRTLWVVLFMILAGTAAFAQEPAPQTTDQTPLQEEVTKTANALRDMVVGSADSLAGSAIKHSERLGKTPIGKGIMFMIAWKILGKDILQLIIGFIMLVFVLVFFVRFYKRDCLLTATETRLTDGSVTINYKQESGVTKASYFGFFIIMIIIISLVALS